MGSGCTVGVCGKFDMLCCGLFGTLYLCYLRTWAQDVHCTVGVCGKFDMLCCGLLGTLYLCYLRTWAQDVQ